MNIPNFVDIPVIVKRNDGYYWSDEWRAIMIALIQTLQTNASNEGLVPPSQSAANIGIITPSAQTFTLIGDTTNNKLKVKLQDGTFHSITTL